MPALRFISLLIIFAPTLLPAADVPAKENGKNASVRFSRDILPILSDKCFVCHGPDVHDADMLRLDSVAAATEDRGGYFAINPKSPEKSEVLKRIHSVDDPMPPADADKQLNDHEKQLLERWIQQGGEYEQHWAFVSPWKSLPERDRNLTQGHPVDYFIERKLQQADVRFADQADLATLARRASLVLTGLPPKPERVVNLLNDRRSNAYEIFIDELLASPQFGEHQARYWLDAVRYGDTHGLHLDNRRGVYPYRDWVVRAFNKNMPLDEFITWQLAGDLFPEPTLDQLVATGFVRMNPTTSEGGVIPAEFQAKNNFDRVETLGTVLLGMTMTCARCHTHKYDPIPQTEYYRLLAFFNNTAESSLDGNSYVYGPVINVPKDQKRWSEWEKIEHDVAQLLKQVDPKSDKFQQPLLEYAKSKSELKVADWKATPAVAVNAAIPEDAKWKAVQGLPGEINTTLPKPHQAIWVSFSINTTSPQSLWLTYFAGTASEMFLDDQPVNPIEQSSAQKTSGDHQLIHSSLIEATPGNHVVRMKLAGTNQKVKVRIQFQNAWQQLAKADAWDACSTKDQLLMLTDVNSPLAKLNLHDEARQLLSRVVAAESDFTTTLVARELPRPRQTFLLKRGEYNAPIGEPLTPGVVSVMGGLPDNAPPNRLGLAQWLTSKEHPLVARVLVNRLWQRIIGEGLVRTPEDFGLQGQQPTHPHLLDWLAVELQRSDWDMKHMLRLMVTSHTFRQSSRWRDGISDPENKLFARGPSYRLDAEVLRDVALWSSGMLDPHMGGEGVKPYQPSGMWSAMAHPASNTKQYVRDKGDVLYRRSLYVYWKRTSPHPMMTLFDAPDRESSCVRRSRTTTSLQSLGLLNETQRLELSRKLAERLMNEADDTTSRLDRLFMLLATRKPTDPERQASEKLLDQARQRYQSSPADAEALLSIGDAGRDQSLNPVDVAAWTQVTVTVLASDIAILLY